MHPSMASRNARVALTFLLLTGPACARQTLPTGAGTAAVPGLGDGGTATVFSPGTVSGANVFQGSFTPDGRALYFFKRTATDPAVEGYRIFVTRWDGARWTEPDTVDLGGSHSDLYPAISPDGERLVFSSYRPLAGDSSGHPSAYLWMAARQGDGWGRPVPLREATLPGHYHSQVGFSADGTLAFKRQTHEYRAAGSWRAPWNGLTYVAEPDPAIDALRALLPPGKFLYEIAPGPGVGDVILVVADLDAQGRPGHPDLWTATRRGDGWSAPCPLEAGVNTPVTENFPFVTPDRRFLFFVRDFADLVYVDFAAAAAGCG